MVVILALANLISYTSAIPTTSVSIYSDSVEAKARPRNQPRFVHSNNYDDGGDADGDEYLPNTFLIPGTNTTIVLNTEGRGPPVAIKAVLNGSYAFVRSQLLASGDGQLPQNVDPFYYDLNNGAFVMCQSVPGQHLTWGILGAALGWLFHHLGEQSAYKTLSTFHIWEAPWGLIANGQATAGYTGKALPKIVAGPDGVTQYS